MEGKLKYWNCAAKKHSFAAEGSLKSPELRNKKSKETLD